jgi:two-component system nitrate/nitrite response regulator NarL
MPYVPTDAMKATSPKKRDAQKARLVSGSSAPTLVDDSHLAATGSIRILVADRHPLFRFGARELLRRQHDCLVVAESETAEQTVALARAVSAAIVLLDSGLAVYPMDVLTRLHETGVRTIVVGETVSQSEIAMLMRLGARGIITKDAAPDLFVKCVRAVAAGELWLARRDLAQIVNALNESAGATMAPAGLTQREREVIELVATGESNRNIALRLSITEDTVKHHLTNVFDKTGVSNRLELTLFAQKHDLIKIA